MIISNGKSALYVPAALHSFFFSLASASNLSLTESDSSSVSRIISSIFLSRPRSRFLMTRGNMQQVQTRRKKIQKETASARYTADVRIILKASNTSVPDFMVTCSLQRTVTFLPTVCPFVPFQVIIYFLEAIIITNHNYRYYCLPIGLKRGKFP